MKKTEDIREARGCSIMKQAILTLGLVALLCGTGHAGNMTGNYQGMAYLAEQEIRTQELQARQTEKAKELVADAEVNNKELEEKEK